MIPPTFARSRSVLPWANDGRTLASPARPVSGSVSPRIAPRHRVSAEGRPSISFQAEAEFRTAGAVRYHIVRTMDFVAAPLEG